jgi:hypothetical protein
MVANCLAFPSVLLYHRRAVSFPVNAFHTVVQTGTSYRSQPGRLVCFIAVLDHISEKENECIASVHGR